MVPRVLRRLPPYCSPILALRGLEFRSLLFGSRCENGKARPAAWGGGNVDAMTQNCERLPHDEETDAETVTLCGIKPGERFEYPRNLLSEIPMPVSYTSIRISEPVCSREGCDLPVECT